MKLGDFLNTIAAKSGKQNEKAFVDLLANADLARIELEDGIANEINASLMNIDGAKNNSSIKSHFYASALAGVDSELLTTAAELGLDPDTISALKADKDTYNKMRVLRDKAKEQLSKQTQGSGEKTTELSKMIQDLNAQLAAEKKGRKADLEAQKQTHTKEIIDYIVSANLSAKNYAESALPAQVRIKVAKSLLEDNLAQKGISLVNENGSIRLKQAANPELDYYDSNNKPLSFDDFTNQILAENKLLAASNPDSVRKSAIQSPAYPPEGSQVDTSRFNSAIVGALADIKQ